MQRKPSAPTSTASSASLSSAAASSVGISQRDRRSMLQGPYGLQQLQPPLSHQPSYAAATMAMTMGGLGAMSTMTMSDMESSMRSFAPPQLQPGAPSGLESANSTSFWRPTSMVDIQQQQQQQDLEFNDFLNPRGSGDDATGGDVTMTDVPTSFSLPSTFGSFSSMSAASSVAPLNVAHVSMLQGSTSRQGPSSSASTSPTSDASSTRSVSARPAVPVAAAFTGAPDANDYSRFVDSTDEPDLSQHKIEQKNEKCQYHNCPNRARVSQAYGKFCNRHVIVAPCGFPGCRDKAMLHSSMCDKHLAEGKEALHRILANRAQNVPVCRTFGCFKNDQGRGYCRGHEKLLMATGRLPKHINKRRLNSAYTMCSYPNCNKHSQRNHLCRTHGNMILKQAEEMAKQSTSGESFEDILARLQKEIRRCTHPTCTKNSQRDRLCTMHYYEKHNLQRDGAQVSGKEVDIHLSSTDGGGSESEGGTCTFDGCSQNAAKRGLCKYHFGHITPSDEVSSSLPIRSEGTTQDSSVNRNHRICSIQGCGNIAPYASGLCAHHGNKTNQAIQITRINPHVPAISNNGAIECAIPGCGTIAVPGAATCEQHSQQRRAFTNVDMACMRPSIGDGHLYSSQSAPQFLSPSDPNSVLGNSLDRYGVISSGTTGRMANLSVSSGPTSSAAESDARQALVNLNGTSKSSTCNNPICSKETSYGREFCDSCQNIFSPLVVSVGDGSGGSNPYQFGSLGAGSQPENDMWGDGSQSKTTTKSKDLCRLKECNQVASRGGLCDDHFRLFQAGSISVDELTLRSRQIREEKERAAAEAAAAAAAAAAEMKQASSPKIKKYFCKADGCDKQAQKRGLCKRHYRILESGEGPSKHGSLMLPSLPSSSFDNSDNNHLDPMMVHHQQCCRFPNCTEGVNASTTLCPSHAKATYCWQAGCENLVESPQFCEYHSYRFECAYEGCSYQANRGSSGCGNHVMERRCSHDHCDHFALGRSDRCRLHLDDCTQQPCTLCELYGLNEPSFPYGVAKSSLHNIGGGNNGFVDERELARQSIFGEGRLL